jgi:hypothetical protein
MSSHRNLFEFLGLKVFILKMILGAKIRYYLVKFGLLKERAFDLPQLTKAKIIKADGWYKDMAGEKIKICKYSCHGYFTHYVTSRGQYIKKSHVRLL